MLHCQLTELQCNNSKSSYLHNIQSKLFTTSYQCISFFHLGPVAVSTPAKLVSPGYVINGTMSVTKSELYFEMDDDEEENKKIDPKVSDPFRARSHRAKATSLRWVLSISIVLFTLSERESKSNVAFEWAHDPF